MQIFSYAINHRPSKQTRRCRRRPAIDLIFYVARISYGAKFDIVCAHIIIIAEGETLETLIESIGAAKERIANERFFVL